MHSCNQKWRDNGLAIWRERHVEVVIGAGKSTGAIFIPAPIRRTLARISLKKHYSSSNLKIGKSPRKETESTSMVGLPYDCLANPLGAVRSTFDKAVSSGSNPSALDGKEWGAAEIFRRFLFDDGGLSQVRILTLCKVFTQFV